MNTTRGLKVAGFTEDKHTTAAVQRAQAMFLLRERIHSVVARAETPPRTRRSRARPETWPAFRGLDALKL